MVKLSQARNLRINSDISMEEALRIYLFLGMVIHKLIWEVLKRRHPQPPSGQIKETSIIKSLIKIAKVIFLIFLLLQTLILPVLFPISSQPLFIQVMGLIIYTFGLLVAILGRIQLGENWANLEDYQVLQEQKLVNHGVYQYIRHPIYLGDLLLILGLELALNSWLLLLIIPLACVVYYQARNEEMILSAAFSGYRTYQKQTKMFIPHVI